MNNIKDLTNDLKNVYQEAREGKIEHKQLKELANVAGKILKAAALNLEYNRYQNDNAPIEFLETK